MDGMSPAQFDESDAGSGPVEEEVTPSPVHVAVQNLLSRHLHEIGVTVTDERQFLRTWRRQLQELLAGKHAQMLKFLMAPGGDGEGVQAFSRRVSEVLTKYSKPTWNFASSIRDVALSTDMVSTASAIQEELGINPEQVEQALKKAIRAYLTAATRVCSTEERLQDKFRRLDDAANCVEKLLHLDPAAASVGLTESASAYLSSVFDKIDLQTDYTELVEQYKRFAILKNLVALNGFHQSAAPTCTICMTKEVTQALNPCGHTFCDDCCRQQMTTCYICRVQVRDRLRLFFS